MAITRAQQAKQMLQDGGMLVKPGFSGTRQGYRGVGEYGGGDEGPPTGNTGNTGNTGGKSDRGRDLDFQQRGMSKADYAATAGDREQNFGGRPPSFTDRIKGLPNKMRIIGLKNKLNKFANINQIKGPLGFQVVNAFNPGNLTAQDYADIFGSPDLDQLGMTGKDLTNIDNTIDALDKAEKTGITQGEFEKAFFGPDGPPVVDDRGGNVRPPIRYGIPAAAQTADADDSDYYGGKNPFDINRIAYRLMADGGAVMDDEPRQAYGLGDIVKKATRAVKKVAKSPVGKAALLYAGTAGLSYLGAGAGAKGAGFGIFSPGNVGANLGTSFLRLKATPFGEKIFGRALTDYGTRQGGLLNLLKSPLGAITGASILAGLMTKKDEDDEEEEFSRGEGLNIPEYRRDPFGNLAIRFRAEGGSTEEKEPVAKKVMPLIDMGGKEKDYRETGGFVDMGRMEKADDVPARLSKNEFVFTADAVRNAGDGSVDKGAEVMYNMMKNLEAGGEVSEESQGLEGARKMFQTSQRLEEVL